MSTKARRQILEQVPCPMSIVALLMYENREIKLSAEQRRHLVNLCRMNASKNRELSRQARDAGDLRAEGFHAGQALAYRRMAQRIDELEGSAEPIVSQVLDAYRLRERLERP